MGVKTMEYAPGLVDGERVGAARIYLDPEPESGSHPGYRGRITADAMGAHLSSDCEWLAFNSDDDRFDTEWELLDTAQTIPWARIHHIAWQEESDAS